MQYFRSGYILVSALTFSCLCFGQLKPQLVIGQTFIDFDQKYVSELNPIEKQELLKLVIKPLQNNIEQGASHIHEIDLKNLANEFSNVKLYKLLNDAHAIGVGNNSGRFGSVYISETQSVYINQDITDYTSKQNVPLLAHELLGALGYNDTNYQISSVLFARNSNSIIQKINATSLRPQLKLPNTPQLKINLNQFDKNGTKLKSDGGVTVIGGGGDEDLINVKIFMLNDFQNWKESFLIQVLNNKNLKDSIQSLTSIDLEKLNNNSKIFDDFLVQFINMPFEPMTYQYGMKSEQISDSMDIIGNAIGIFENEKKETIARISKQHWTRPIKNSTLLQSQEIIARSLQGMLFVDYLTTRYPR